VVHNGYAPHPESGGSALAQPASQRPAIAVAVVVSDGRVLMVRRRVAEGALSWQFPAGKVEPGETDEEAAARETYEETGVAVRPFRRLGGRVHPMTGRMMAYIACGFISGIADVADPDEIDQVEWCDLEALAKYVPRGLFGPVRRYLDSALI
jgi:8-oxo-dGTP diphosphatase